MKIGSLFSGAGALDMAVEQVFGASTVWHCEYDAPASKVLAAHWDIPNHRDITTVDWDTVEPVDILCGGYPCQPFSSAGQRKGHNDERHLWPYFAEAIRRIGPQYVILENVAGHRAMGFDSVLADLAAMRFDADWCSLRASDIGAPHGRDRIFVVAYPQHGTGHRERSRQELGQGDSPTAHTEHVGSRGEADDARGRQCNSAGRDLRVQSSRRSPSTPDADSGRCGGRAQRDLEPEDGLSAPRWDDVNGRAAGDGGDYGLTDWGRYGAAIARWEELTRTCPKPSEDNKTGRPRLTAAFSEWLMGWPAGWVTDVPGISRNDQLRIIGNGVVPQQAVAALRWLLSISEVAA